MKSRSKVRETLEALASEGKLLTLEAKELLRLWEAGLALDERELEDYLANVRKVRQALYAIVARNKGTTEDNSASELRKLFL